MGDVDTSLSVTDANPTPFNGNNPIPDGGTSSNDQLGDPICVLQTQTDSRTWMREYLRRQIEWSQRTFGSGHRTIGLTTHIRKELDEICDQPHDLEEWIDVLILAFDGAWRSGAQRHVTPDEIIEMLEHKQQKNFDRTWPTPTGADEPIEHVRGEHA